MDKQAAANLIADTFDSAFTEDRFRFFIRNLLDEIAEFREFRDSIWITGHIKASFKEHIKKYKRIGKYTDQDGNKLDVIIVHLRKETALERARTMQRNFVASYLKTRGEKDAAIVAYFTDSPEDWRFSFVRMEYKQDISESGRVRVREELTSARRYSFLVGKNEPNHTAQEQIIPLLQDDRNNPTIEELETAFNVETVTKRFYTDYRGLSEKLVEELGEIIEQNEKIKTEFETKSIDTPNFAKKLLGQIVFLYFVQKKGWLGVGKDDKGNFKHWGTGPKNFLRLLFKKKFIDYKNFFNDVLEPLFYIALATERENDYYDRLDCRTPFLNGGLFEPINGYNWQETDILISDDLLNEIFDTFDRYNFTVREDEPLEKEVAVDPEMLGKVFENLLPENLRKGKGTYYTPREIVHYMCQESLINYLDTAVNTGEVSLARTWATQGRLFGKPDPEQLSLKTTGYTSIIARQDIEDFIRKGEFAVEHDIAKETGTKSYKYQVPGSIRNNAIALDDKLANIKVCDPAVGSGAFPVGMMHEIVKARNVLTTYLKNKSGRSIYNFKRHCIQESLYGVDIDPGAIDIAKLRLWLSLIVDEEDYHNIQPLPNLDYKIMQGNSLIEDFHGISLNLVKKESENENLFAGDNELDHLIETLHEKQNALFNATHPGDKRQLKEAVEESIVDIFHYELERQKEPYFKGLKNIKETSDRFPNTDDQMEYYTAEKAKLDKEYNFDFETIENEMREMTRGNMERNFFPWKLYFADVFRENGGFDVVIANPPYLKERDNKKVFEIVNNSDLGKKYHQGKMDYWYYFLHMAIDIIRREGTISYITSRYWLNSSGAKKLISRVKENLSFIDFIDIGKLKVFSEVAGQHMVAVYAKNKTIEDFIYKKLINDLIDIDKNQDTDNVTIRSLKNSKIFSESHEIIIEKDLIEFNKSINLGVICDVFQGVVQNPDKVSITSANKYNLRQGEGVFVVNQKEYKTLKLNVEERNFIRLFYDEYDIHKYLVRTQEKKYIIYLTTFNCTDIDRFPNLKKHLFKYKKIMDARRETKKGVNKWFHLHWPREEEYFKRKKLILPAMFERQAVGYQEEEGYFGLSSNVIIQNNEDYDLKYILAILNSNLALDWFYRYGKKRGVGVDIGVSKLRTFPVRKLSLQSQKPLITFVDRILAITKDEDYLQNPQKQAQVKELEREVDRMVYELYGLTKEDIAIVEESARR